MKTIKGKFPITRKISVWNRPLKIDFKGVFKSLTKAIVKAKTGDIAGAGINAIKVFSIIGFEEDPGQMAWVLIQRALVKSIYDLVEENQYLIADRGLEDIDNLEESLDLSLEESEMTLDKCIFENPRNLEIVELIKTPFKQWLRECKIKEGEADAIVGRLPSYFVYALYEEWFKNRERYTIIQNALDTPFDKAVEREQAWAKYNAYLLKQVDGRMFEETFGLKQVYVSLRGYETQKVKHEEEEDEHPGKYLWKENTERIVFILEEKLLAWIDKEDKKDAMRVISGGPGSGKSSLAKMFAAKEAERAKNRVLYIPLHRIDVLDNLEKSIWKYIRETDILPYNPLNPDEGERRLFVILDGLDELTMKGKSANEVARDYLREVERTIENRNTMSLHLQVLITGRTLAVQASGKEIYRPETVYHVLPYFIRDEERERYHDPGGYLNEDQRQLWWNGYGRAIGLPTPGIPEYLKRKELEDITSQPLLNYLVALIITYTGKGFDTGEVNRNEIYEKLLKGVYERGWEGRRFELIKDIEEEDFSRILEEIALCAWHGKGRTITVREVERYCSKSGLAPMLDKFQERAKEAVSRLLLAFYFQEFGKNQEGEKTFEFTHKSFGEYLTAKRLVKGIELMTEEIDRRTKRPGSGWDEQETLKHWVEWFGTTAIDHDLFEFLKDEIELHGLETCTEWQETFCSMIEYILGEEMPMHQVNNIGTYKEAIRQARNSEEALLACLYACARVTKKISNINWPDGNSAGAWISRLRGIVISYQEISFSLRCWGYLNLNQQFIGFQELPNVNFCNADFENANLVGSGLMEAFFRRANLKNAHLFRAILVGAFLMEANLEKANLTQAVLKYANLGRANLSKANLVDADLDQADLKVANLVKADLTDANLSRARLWGANFEDTNFNRTNLENADFKGAKNLDKAQNLDKARNLDKALGIDEELLKSILDKE